VTKKEAKDKLNEILVAFEKGKSSYSSTEIKNFS
jgi:hypothetical protein